MKFIREFFATGFYTGYLKPMPGTIGSWAALCVYLILTSVSPISAENTALFLSMFFFFVGLLVCDKEAKRLGKKDPPSIVIDEFAGLFFTFVASPFSYLNAIVGFFLFRLFDILKPYPIRTLQNLPGAWGIMLDDLAAALYAALLLSFFSPHLAKIQEFLLQNYFFR